MLSGQPLFTKSGYLGRFSFDRLQFEYKIHVFITLKVKVLSFWALVTFDPRDTNCHAKPLVH